MKRVCRMLSRWRPEALPPVVAQSERLELAQAKVEQHRILSRADLAIHEAMAHADEVFGPQRVERRKARR
jgi:hypothetical protein